MTVKELIEELKKFPEDMEVLMSDTNMVEVDYVEKGYMYKEEGTGLRSKLDLTEFEQEYGEKKKATKVDVCVLS